MTEETSDFLSLSQARLPDCLSHVSFLVRLSLSFLSSFSLSESVHE